MITAWPRSICYTHGSGDIPLDRREPWLPSLTISFRLSDPPTGSRIEDAHRLVDFLPVRLLGVGDGDECCAEAALNSHLTTRPR
jgi:hypothetical protein